MWNAKSLPSYQPEETRVYHAQKQKKKRTVTLHDSQELDNDLGRRSDHDLTLAGLLGIVDGVQAIVEDGSLDHFGGCRFSMASGRLRYLRKSFVVSLQMPEHGECPQCADMRVLQLLSQRRSSVALILAGGCDCSSWLSEGHSVSRWTYLVRERDGLTREGWRLAKSSSSMVPRKLSWLVRLARSWRGWTLSRTSPTQHAPQVRPSTPTRLILLVSLLNLRNSTI